MSIKFLVSPPAIHSDNIMRLLECICARVALPLHSAYKLCKLKKVPQQESSTHTLEKNTPKIETAVMAGAGLRAPLKAKLAATAHTVVHSQASNL